MISCFNSQTGRGDVEVDTASKAKKHQKLRLAVIAAKASHVIGR